MYRTYSTGKAAAAAWVRLLGELPGSVRGIDYRKLAMAVCSNGDIETQQDVAMEKLDTFRDLSACLMRAQVAAGVDAFRTWLHVRVIGRTLREAAKALDRSERQVQRIVRKVDSAVTDALVERELLPGFDGRDMLEAGIPRQRCVEVVWDHGALAWLRGEEDADDE